MKFQNRENRAFTLLETLLVLSITSFILFLFSFSVGKTLKLVKGELFVVQFENIYADTQFRASSSRSPCLLTCKNQEIKFDNETVKLPKEVQIKDFSIKFDKYGNNSSLQKLVIYLPNESKTITYQLEMGSGKYKKTVQ